MEAVRIVVRCAVWGESNCRWLLRLEQSKKTRSAIYKGKRGLNYLFVLLVSFQKHGELRRIEGGFFLALWRGGGEIHTKRRLAQEERDEVKEYWVSTASVDKSDASTGQTLTRLLDDDWNVDKNDKQRCEARIERENCSPVRVVSQLQGLAHVTHLNLHPSFHDAFGFVN